MKPDNSFCFAIIERNFLIAQDMAEGLIEAAGPCDSRTYADLDELLRAEKALLAATAHPVIITKASLDMIARSGVAAMAERNGWPVVVRLDFDTAEDVHARGWLTLPAIFRRSDLVQLVRDLRGLWPGLTRKLA